jgi:hypothetical protein
VNWPSVTPVPGSEWIEIRGLNQSFVIPAWFDEVSDLKGFPLSILDEYQVEPEPEAITELSMEVTLVFALGIARNSCSQKNRSFICQLSVVKR